MNQQPTMLPLEIERRLFWAVGLFLGGVGMVFAWPAGGVLLLLACVGLSVRSVRLLAIWDAAEAAKEEAGSALLRPAEAICEEEEGESFEAEVERRMGERVF